jgi:hypothetical protein
MTVVLLHYKFSVVSSLLGVGTIVLGVVWLEGRRVFADGCNGSGTYITWHTHRQAVASGMLDFHGMKGMRNDSTYT